MIFGPNDSPLAGREGTQLTGSKIGERLNAEAETSVSLRVLPVDGGGESFEVQARGELQLGLLIGKCATPLTRLPTHWSKNVSCLLVALLCTDATMASHRRAAGLLFGKHFQVAQLPVHLCEPDLIIDMTPAWVVASVCQGSTARPGASVLVSVLCAE